jgi:UDP-N-acetylmuramoylalanine--D-glutamate ligase
VHAVVAIGEAAAEVTAAFGDLVPVRRATSMGQAVEMAGQLAGAGDAVVLSPGCASFDWYSSYAQRGEHFSALVKARLAKDGNNDASNTKNNDSDSDNDNDTAAAIDKPGEVGER